MTEYKYSGIGIYRILCIENNKSYIGQSKVGVGKRKNIHFLNLRKGIHYSKEMQEDFKKYGENGFSFEFLEEVKDLDNIDEREKFWIKHLNSLQFGYNQCTGGKGAQGIKRTDEMKKTVGEKNSKNMLGKKHSEETKKKMSETHKKLPIHPNSLNKLLEFGRKKLTEKQKEHLRKINTGEKNPTHKYSNETVLAIKQMIDSGERVKDIVLKFGVSRTTVNRIRNNETRKDILN